MHICFGCLSKNTSKLSPYLGDSAHLLSSLPCYEYQQWRKRRTSFRLASAMEKSSFLRCTSYWKKEMSIALLDYGTVWLNIISIINHNSRVSQKHRPSPTFSLATLSVSQKYMGKSAEQSLLRIWIFPCFIEKLTPPKLRTCPGGLKRKVFQFSHFSGDFLWQKSSFSPLCIKPW